VKCQYCGRDEALPFKCPYCQGFFCAEHRLPESHACHEGWRARAFSEEAPQTTRGGQRGQSPYEYTITYKPSGLKPRRFWFSQTEIKHLAISALLVMGVGLSWVLLLGLTFLPLEILFIMAFVFTFVFLSHEMAHKIVAQHYGLWAEFRLTLFGALITLLSIVSPFKIVSPGAVMIAGSSDRGTVGKTSIAGPLTNIIFCAVSFSLTQFLTDYFFVVALFSAAFNAFIAVLNLIPIAILDGKKIFDWDKIVWAAAFSSSVALMIGIFALYPQLLI